MSVCCVNVCQCVLCVHVCVLRDCDSVSVVCGLWSCVCVVVCVHIRRCCVCELCMWGCDHGCYMWVISVFVCIACMRCVSGCVAVCVGRATWEMKISARCPGFHDGPCPPSWIPQKAGRQLADPLVFAGTCSDLKRWLQLPQPMVRSACVLGPLLLPVSLRFKTPSRRAQELLPLRPVCVRTPLSS